MAAVRWGRSTLELAPATPKVRWGRSELGGTALITPKVRWGRSDLTGAAGVVIQPFTNIVDVDAGTLVTLTAVLTGGGAADSYAWRRVSGAPVTIFGSGATVTLRAPSILTGGAGPVAASVVIGVRATIGGTTSPEQTVTVSAFPATEGWYDTISGTWIGALPTDWV